MTHQLDVARGRDVLSRWCNLAEQRLEHLTELFETGRWRRYHSEVAFLENIQEAKSAVEIWRDLSMREASTRHSAVDGSWLGRAGVSAPRTEGQRDRLYRPSSPPARFPTELPTSETPSVAVIEATVFEPDLPALELAIYNASEPAPASATIQDRYPLLRNAL